MVYIYTLAHPITNEIRYVGKTVNLKKRYIQHITNSVKTHCKSWINSLLKDNLLPKMEVLEETNNELKWEQLEQYWINQLQQWGYSLTNHTSGGEGRHNSIVSKETRNKMAAKRIGKILSTESKLKISEKNKGKIRSNSNKNKISQSLKDFYKVHEHPIKGFKRSTCNNKLVAEQVLQIRKLLLEGKYNSQIAPLFNVSKATIQQIRRGVTWQSLGEFKIPEKWKIKKKDTDHV